MHCHSLEVRTLGLQGIGNNSPKVGSHDEEHKDKPWRRTRGRLGRPPPPALLGGRGASRSLYVAVAIRDVHPLGLVLQNMLGNAELRRHGRQNGAGSSRCRQRLECRYDAIKGGTAAWTEKAAVSFWSFPSSLSKSSFVRFWIDALACISPKLVEIDCAA